MSSGLGGVALQDARSGSDVVVVVAVGRRMERRLLSLSLLLDAQKRAVTGKTLRARQDITSLMVFSLVVGGIVSVVHKPPHTQVRKCTGTK